MKRIHLTKSAKQVFHLLDKGICLRPDYISESDFNNGARELHLNGLAICHEEENGNVEIVRITEHGKRYWAFNPRLRNPVDTKWVLSFCIGAASMIIALIALFISCTTK